MSETSEEPTKYDSKLSTLEHSRRVDELLMLVVIELQLRVTRHDLSKLEDPEKSTFDEYSQKLQTTTYGSDEYKSHLAAMKPALDHHYGVNRHHPEHFTDGVDGMTLVDIIEMLCDWKAAGERHADGSMVRSLEIQTSRFKLSPQLLSILKNTAKGYGWYY